MAERLFVLPMEWVPDPTGRATGGIWQPEYDRSLASIKFSVIANAREFCVLWLRGDDAELDAVAASAHAVPLDGGAPRTRDRARLRQMMDAAGFDAAVGLDAASLTTAIQQRQAVETVQERAARKAQARTRMLERRAGG